MREEFALTICIVRFPTHLQVRRRTRLGFAWHLVWQSRMGRFTHTFPAVQKYTKKKYNLYCMIAERRLRWAAGSTYQPDF